VTTYITKSAPFFSGALKNSIVKRAYWKTVLEWVTFWEVSQVVCERGQSTPKLQMVSESTHDCKVRHWMGEP